MTHLKGSIRPVLIVCFGFLLIFHAQAFAQVASTPSPPTHPMTLEQIEKLMTLTRAADRIKAAMHANIQTQRDQKKQIFPPVFWNELEQELEKIDWIRIATPVYQKYFSVEEADAVIAFYSTSVGQKVLESSAVITQELTTQGYAIGKDIGQKLGEKYQKEIQENAKKIQSERNASQSQP